MVPVSLRAEGDSAMNNQVSMVRVDLATDITELPLRLKAIHASSEAAKAVVKELKPVLGLEVPITGSPWLMTGLASLLGRSNLASRAPAAGNVVISNVPGPPMTLYMAGARMVHYYPVSIPYHGSGLNITVQSYAGLLEFGLTACRRVVSQEESYEIVAHLQAALREIEALPTIHADAGVESAGGRSGDRTERSDRTEQGLHEEDRRSTAESARVNRAGVEPRIFAEVTNMQPTAANKSSPQSSLFENGALKALFSKIDRRLIPILLISYMIAYLDRINIGYAQLQMKQTLPFDDAVYGLGAGMFFIGYFLFEVPSNLLLERIGARKTLLRIMVLWGLCCVSHDVRIDASPVLCGAIPARRLRGRLLPWCHSVFHLLVSVSAARSGDCDFHVGHHHHVA